LQDKLEANQLMVIEEWTRMFGNEKKSDVIIAIATVVAIVFSSISLLLSLYYSDTIYPGGVTTLEPVGFGIIRQLPDIGSQSDYIILPLEGSLP
jgi:hypothetical protein